MRTWTQEEIDAMRLADSEIEEEFCMTREEIMEGKARDTEAIDGQLGFSDLKRMQCQREYNKRYYAAHKEKLNERSRRYRQEHLGECRERERAWRERNADYVQTYQRAYSVENKAIKSVKNRAAYEVRRALKRLTETAEAEA